MGYITRVHHGCHYTHRVMGMGHKGMAVGYIRFTLSESEAMAWVHGFVDYKFN